MLTRWLTIFHPGPENKGHERDEGIGARLIFILQQTFPGRIHRPGKVCLRRLGEVGDNTATQRQESQLQRVRPPGGMNHDLGT